MPSALRKLGASRSECPQLAVCYLDAQGLASFRNVQTRMLVLRRKGPSRFTRQAATDQCGTNAVGQLPINRRRRPDDSFPRAITEQAQLAVGNAQIHQVQRGTGFAWGFLQAMGNSMGVFATDAFFCLDPFELPGQFGIQLRSAIVFGGVAAARFIFHLWPPRMDNFIDDVSSAAFRNDI
jgi:hypothetical protein